MREPCFDQVLSVLGRESPSRPTLFEFFLNPALEEKLSGMRLPENASPSDVLERRVTAFAQAGYDYVTTHASEFNFPHGESHQKESVSLNSGALISDEASFHAYPWPDPESFSLERLEHLGRILPPGMKAIVHGPFGVLENVIRLTGYEPLCFLVADEPELVQTLFDRVGERLLRYYELALEYDVVGAVIGNDDWGFKTQTMLSTENMRRYVFPWHKRIVAAAHAAGRPAILHSCGNPEAIIDDVIDDIRYDGRHSYEDTIVPVEDAYERWYERIAILGGIDLDFVCRSTPEEIRTRCLAMLDRTAGRGGYALGTGNSVPAYVPAENYFAMIDCVREAGADA